MEDLDFMFIYWKLYIQYMQHTQHKISLNFLILEKIVHKSLY